MYSPVAIQFHQVHCNVVHYCLFDVPFNELPMTYFPYLVVSINSGSPSTPLTLRSPTMQQATPPPLQRYL